jgi:hypothetical protein
MSQKRLVKAVQRAVRGLVLGLSRADRLRLVAHLVCDAGLTDDQVSRLLCFPWGALTDLLREARASRPPGLEPPEAARLLGGLSGAARAG